MMATSTIRQGKRQAAGGSSVWTVTQTGDDGWNIGTAGRVSGIDSAPCSIPVDIGFNQVLFGTMGLFSCVRSVGTNSGLSVI